MKVVLGAVVVLVLMIGVPSVQSVFANQSNTDCDDSCQEAGIGADGLDRPCTYGPDHDECHDQFFERTHNLPALPPNQYYGVCIEGPKLVCDILTVSVQRASWVTSN